MADLTVANTILAQLGGARFKAMTGASSFTGGTDCLTFRIPQSKGIRAVRITLMPSDTYKMEFLGIRKYEVKTVAVVEDVYCDMLQEIFTRYTGLDTRL